MEPERPASTHPRTSPNPAGEARQPRLLIVEDDGSLAAGLARALALEGYKVEHLDSGERALASIGEEAFDLVVLDIGLPGIDGFEVLRRLRLAGQTMPVLVLTARDAVGDRVHGLDLGADDYMTKPFALPELAARFARSSAAASRTPVRAPRTGRWSSTARGGARSSRAPRSSSPRANGRCCRSCSKKWRKW